MKKFFSFFAAVLFAGSIMAADAPAAAPAEPTVPANQVKAVYSATYSADCNFGEWGSGTVYTQETVGKKYVTTNLGYFGLEFSALNCSSMEKLHLDVWVANDASIRIVPIHGGTEQGVTANLTGDKWNSVDIALSEYDQVSNWANVFQIKIDNAANLTFWLNNVYFYTTVAPEADVTAPADFTASLAEASYFSVDIKASATDASGAVTYNVINGELIVATANGASGEDKVITVSGLTAKTTYNFSVVAKDESGNAAEPVAVEATTKEAPAPAAAPTYAADKVLALECNAYESNLAYGIQDWWSMPAVIKGKIAANSDALCIIPNATAGSCFGMAFAKTDITAYDALEMDVYPTVAEAKLKIQVIGVGEAATEFALEANKWNHIVLDIKGNAKTDCEQVGFYDCNNLLAACFVQNVLFVDNDAPAAHQYEVAEAIAAGLTDDTEILVRGIITKMEFKGKNFAKYGSVNIYVKDATGAEGEFEFYNCYSLNADTFKTSTPAYDASSTSWFEPKEVADANGNTIHVGDTVVAFGKYKLYNTTHELNTGCNLVEIKHAATQPIEPGEEIEVTLHSGLIWYDLVDSYGFWQLVNEQLSISNTESDEVAGTYNVGTDLDDEWTYLVPESGDTVRFVSGSLVVAVADNGDVTITGTMVGDDGNTYKFDLFYSDPKPEKTVNISIPDWDLDDTYLDYGLFALAGEAENGDYVQIALWMPEDAADIYGEYTDEDLDDQYLGSWLEIGDEEPYIFSATVKIEEGAEGRALVTAELLCYNNTLYKVTTLVGEGYDYIYGSKKAIKSIMNGQLIIEKNGVRYNANGAVIR